MKKHVLLLFFLFILLLQTDLAARDHIKTRFFYSGDGSLSLKSERNGKTFYGRYRNLSGEYYGDQLAQINKLFGAVSDSDGVYLRLIEFLDFLQDRLGGGRVIITSGYRSPEYNTDLRNRGGLAAKASLHQYGMAADIIMERISSRRIWEFVKSLGFGGSGYYHGKTVHIDIGPARWWDEKISGVDSGNSDDNKLIMIVTDRDIYFPGEEINFGFARVTAWPVGMKPKFLLEEVDDGKKMIYPEFGNENKKSKCCLFKNLQSMKGISWRIPEKLRSGKYKVHISFCGKKCISMPDSISTPIFEVYENPKD